MHTLIYTSISTAPPTVKKKQMFPLKGYYRSILLSQHEIGGIANYNNSMIQSIQDPCELSFARHFTFFIYMKPNFSISY